MQFPKHRVKLSIWQYLAIGYLIVIAVGTVLLVMPFAVRDGKVDFLNAFFTATSATCVTGLTPVETNIHWTVFGQIVILLLIQLGGLGFMTFVSVLLLMVKGGLGQYERRAFMQSMGGQSDGVKALVLRVFVGTICAETAGAALLSIRFIGDFGALRGIYYAIFHAVSAFCNAGFDLMGGTVAGTGSLSYYATDPLVSLTLCALIFLGGLGFCVWDDVIDCRFNFKKFQFYTKIILIASVSLLVCGTGLFMIFERNNPSYAGYGFGDKLLCALFNATTARTAGFWTTDPCTMSDSGYLLLIVLMFIGGCSGSTAGGIKVGTFVVLVTGMWSVFRGKRDNNIGKRRIANSLLGQALAIFASCLMLVLCATLLICAVEPQGQFRETLFEVVSALGTVGLSMSLTATLSAFSKIVLIVLMYAGRVGVLTLAGAVARKRDTGDVRSPVDTFYIG